MNFTKRLEANGHLINFVPEEMSKMTISRRHNSGYYRERSNPFFAAQRWAENDYRFFLISGRMMLNGAKARGMKLNRYTQIDGSLEEARAEAIKRYAVFKAMEIRKKRGLIQYYAPASGLAVTPDILFEKGKEPKQDPSYEPLMSVLMDAYAQAAHGKGSERHANGKDFLDQDLLTITDVTGINGPFYQAIKKLMEGRNLPTKKARAEFLGAIVYIAGAIAWMDKKAGE